jgi:hypothetical protein
MYLYVLRLHMSALRAPSLSTREYRDIGSHNVTRVTIQDLRQPPRATRRRHPTTRTTGNGRWPVWWCSHHPVRRYVITDFFTKVTNKISHSIQASRVSTRSRLVLILVSSLSLSRPRLGLTSAPLGADFVLSRSRSVSVCLVSVSSPLGVDFVSSCSHSVSVSIFGLRRAVQSPYTSHLPGATSIDVRVSNVR